MSSKNTFSTETSERYALALFELAIEGAELDLIQDNIVELMEVYNTNRELEYFIKNPTQSLNAQTKVIQSLSEAMSFSKIFKNFLLILVTKRRIFFLHKISESFSKLCSKKKGHLSASLVSSKKLSSSEIKKISEELSKTIGSSINFNYKLDEELIGGLKIQLGSLMIDSSIKNKLKRYEQLMIEN